MCIGATKEYIDSIWTILIKQLEMANHIIL